MTGVLEYYTLKDWAVCLDLSSNTMCISFPSQAFCLASWLTPGHSKKYRAFNPTYEDMPYSFDLQRCPTVQRKMPLPNLG